MASPSILVIDDSPTILKVVELVLTKAGYDVRTAPDGEEGIRLAMDARPDLILLDFVMPRLNGYQVCRALMDSIDLAEVPVILMSAKGDQVGERFVKVMGIVDYITKPFSPEAITAVVEHTLQKRGNAIPSDSSDDSTDPRNEGRAEVATDELAASDRATQRLAAALHSVRDSLRAALREHHVPVEIIDGHVDAAFSDDALTRALAPYVAEVERATPTAALEGHLGRVPIAEVLSLLREQRQTGVLSVARQPDADLKHGPSGTHIDIAWKSGRIELAMGEGLSDDFLIGRYLVDQGAISKQDFELFLSSRSEKPDQSNKPRPIGEQMVRLQYVSDSELKQALARQSAERIYELLRWPSGRFAFRATRELPPLAVDAALSLDLDVLLIEGFRRIDEWHLIEREIDDFDAIFLRNEEAVQHVGKARLTREELQVLDLITGKNSVKDIVRMSRMSSFDVSKLLFRLLSIKLIRRKVGPVAV